MRSRADRLETARLLLRGIGIAPVVPSLDAKRKPMEFAAQTGRADFVRSMIENVVSPNSSDPRSVTALMRAAYSGHANATRVLLEAGADANAKDCEGGPFSIGRALAVVCRAMRHWDRAPSDAGGSLLAPVTPRCGKRTEVHMNDLRRQAVEGVCALQAFFAVCLGALARPRCNRIIRRSLPQVPPMRRRGTSSDRTPAFEVSWTDLWRGAWREQRCSAWPKGSTPSC